MKNQFSDTSLKNHAENPLDQQLKSIASSPYHSSYLALMLYGLLIVLLLFGSPSLIVVVHGDRSEDEQEIATEGEFQVIRINEFTIPTMINQAFAALGSTGPLDFFFNLEMISDGTRRNVTKDMGLLSLLEEYRTTGTNLIYRFRFVSPTKSVHMPVFLTIFRNQSIYHLIRNVCPEYHVYKLCSHIAYHISEAYWGVNYAPSRTTSNEQDFTMSRSVLIQYLADRYQYRSYLEIGCEYNKNFNLFHNGTTFQVAVGVDPLLGGTLRMTSDEFFHQNRMTFDVIFIDGLHEAHQLYLDVENAMQILNQGGTIVLHDCHPAHPNYASFPRDEEDADFYWNGTPLPPPPPLSVCSFAVCVTPFTFPRRTLSTDSLNIPYQHTLSTHPLNPFSLPTLSTYPLNALPQSTLSSHPLNPPSQPILSTYPLYPPSLQEMPIELPLLYV